jgi:pimeloyl-ACP methyl ester carboxylesterase
MKTPGSSPNMRSAGVNGLRVAYRRAGSGPPLVLLHGFICDSRVWRPQIDALSTDFDVIAWDCPGCGESSDPPEEFSMAQFADCLAGLLDEVGVKSAHLLGLSWGGTLIMEFHRRFPERVRSAILANTYAGWTGSLGPEAAEQRLRRCLEESAKPAADWIPEWVPEAFSPSAPKDLLRDYAEIMSDFHPVGFRAMSRAVTPDFRDALSQIDVPTLLIWGAEDSRSRLSNGEMMCDSIRGARLAVIPKAGHVSNMEQPVRFNAEVARFIHDLESQGAK